MSARLRVLADSIDKQWLAVVAKLPIENCSEAFRFQCPRKWKNPNATGDTAVRFCEECKQNVYYCNDIEEASDHAFAGHCLAVDPSVIRRHNDLRTPPVAMMLGRISPDYFERRIEEERARAEREYGRPAREQRRQRR